MYKERKFKSWEEGLIHLIIVIAVPIIPIAVYMIAQGKSDSYLYVLFVTVIISLLYEFISGYSGPCSKRLKLEKLVTVISLVVVLLASIFFLFLSLAQGGVLTLGNKQISLGWVNGILLCFFLAPVICTIIEIIECIRYDLKKSEYQLDENNLKGASTV